MCAERVTRQPRTIGSIAIQIGMLHRTIEQQAITIQNLIKEKNDVIYENSQITKQLIAMEKRAVERRNQRPK